MKKSPTWLLQHSRNVYSQCGEDGILAKILEVIPDSDRWCVEFGAWDGRHLSNTCNLIENSSYSAVLIEANPKKAKSLAKRHAKDEHIHTVNQLVGFASHNNLDSILGETPIPLNFDLLSIDIDGNDFHAWDATTKYEPKVVCIEFNPTIPTEVEFVQAAAADVTQGSSLQSLVNLGRQKGYELVCVTFCNAIFVKSEYFYRFEIHDNSPQQLRTDTSQVTWLFTGYDGKVVLTGNRQLPWHGVPIQERRVQPLPRIFRRYPDRLSSLNRTLFKAWKKLRLGTTKRAA